MINKYIILYISLIIISFIHCKKFKDEEKPKWAKKDIQDYSEADLERLLDQWDEDEEPLPEDELPEHLRPQPKINFDPDNIGDPEQLMRMSKKGKTLMMFVKVKDKYSPEDANTITQRWQTSLRNNHIQAERYMVDDKRAIFMFKDGALAWEGKDFLIDQPELQDCTLENRPYHGKHTDEYKNEQDNTKKSKQEL